MVATAKVTKRNDNLVLVRIPSTAEWSEYSEFDGIVPALKSVRRFPEGEVTFFLLGDKSTLFQAQGRDVSAYVTVVEKRGFDKQAQPKTFTIVLLDLALDDVVAPEWRLVVANYVPQCGHEILPVAASQAKISFIPARVQR